ncbi:type VI secretion system protein TssA [Treponema primitia]|uniref:type VI secretion system protein TssA n=1 Tax=Treponema primitia TaxID=88058 RepID=UPI00398064AC
MINLGELAVPLEGENPAGENLEYDPLYLELDSLAVETLDSVMGESRIEGRKPDWKKLRENCLSLWGKTRDLRVAVYLSIAETALGGIKDCSEALKLILFLVRDMWDAMYPKLDPEDDNDPIERLNILAMLSPESGAFNDPIMFISKIRALKLTPSLPYSLRDRLISLNELETSDGQSIDPNLILGEVMGVPLAEIEEQAAAARDLQETIKAVCAVAGEKMAGAGILTMQTLTEEIDRFCRTYGVFLDSFGSGHTDAAAAENPDVAGEAGFSSGAALSNLSAYKPASRADALLLLKKGAEYFRYHEPNSPIPLLVNRALRFSEMSFIDLLEDLVPDALPRGKEILGIKGEAGQ